MIEKLEGRDKVNIHLVARKLNEIIELLNNLNPGETNVKSD